MPFPTSSQQPGAAQRAHKGKLRVPAPWNLLMWKRKQDLVTSACDVKLELAGMQQRECVTGLRVQTGTSVTL